MENSRCCYVGTVAEFQSMSSQEDRKAPGRILIKLLQNSPVRDLNWTCLLYVGKVMFCGVVKNGGPLTIGIWRIESTG